MENTLVRLFEGLNKQREDKNFPGIITFKFKDGDTIRVHKFLLMAVSDVFHSIFTNEMKESNQEEIEIDPPHKDGFKAMIEQVCYGKNDKLDYETKIWEIICKDFYRVEYDPDELNINVPKDGLGLLLHLAKTLEYNDTIKQVVAHNCIRHNADIPHDLKSELSDVKIAGIVLYHERDDESFRVYNVVSNKIYHNCLMSILGDGFKNIKKTNTKISYQTEEEDRDKYWIMILNKFNSIGDHARFNPEAMGEKILTVFGEYIYALHPTKDHILIVGVEYMYVFDYRNRKLVDKYKLDFDLSADVEENNGRFSGYTSIKRIELSCNGKYTLLITDEGKYIYEGSKMIKKLKQESHSIKFHPTKENIVTLLSFTDDGDNILIVLDIVEKNAFIRAGSMADYDYYFSTTGRYIIIENKVDRLLEFMPLKKGPVKSKAMKFKGLETDSKTFLVPDPENEQGIYYYIDGIICWININKNVCVQLEDNQDCIMEDISGMLIFNETLN